MLKRSGLEKRQYNQLYRKLVFSDPKSKWFCFYCNEPMDGYDHQPPISQIGYMLISDEPFEAVLVPACIECNSVLSDHQTLTLSERMNELKDALRKRYRTHMRVAGKWTHEEIQELGYSLQEKVLASARIGCVAEYRILYPGHDIKEIDGKIEPDNVKMCKFCDTAYIEDACPACGSDKQ